MLSDIAPKILKDLLQISYVQTLKFHLGPTENIYPGPTEPILYTAKAKP